jgi:hypothetical protein
VISTYGITLPDGATVAELALTEDGKTLVAKLDLDDLELFADAVQEIRDALAARLSASATKA